ncbi:MAG: hypothetical protein J6S67_16800 [Methanobrevibacter sp.]|nr:hypothetical protein [Methanobrevibacter sp.]
MAAIDYENYVKQLGDVPTNQETVIKKYLEEQCKLDEALKAVYVPEKVYDCYKFIKEAVEKLPHTGNFICVEDAVVFKMARDYFIEILPNLKDEKTEEKPVDITPAQEAVKEVAEQIEADATSDNVKRDKYGFEVFGEETEEADEESCHQEEEPVVYEDAGNDEIVQTIVEEECITVTSRPMTEEEKAAEVLQPVAGDTPKYDEEGNGLLFDF